MSIPEFQKNVSPKFETSSQDKAKKEGSTVRKRRDAIASTHNKPNLVESEVNTISTNLHKGITADAPLLPNVMDELKKKLKIEKEIDENPEKTKEKVKKTFEKPRIEKEIDESEESEEDVSTQKDKQIVKGEKSLVSPSLNTTKIEDKPQLQISDLKTILFAVLQNVPGGKKSKYDYFIGFAYIWNVYVSAEELVDLLSDIIKPLGFQKEVKTVIDFLLWITNPGNLTKEDFKNVKVQAKLLNLLKEINSKSPSYEPETKKIESSLYDVIDQKIHMTSLNTKPLHNISYLDNSRLYADELELMFSKICSKMVVKDFLNKDNKLSKLFDSITNYFNNELLVHGITRDFYNNLMEISYSALQRNDYATSFTLFKIIENLDEWKQQYNSCCYKDLKIKDHNDLKTLFNIDNSVALDLLRERLQDLRKQKIPYISLFLNRNKIVDKDLFNNGTLDRNTYSTLIGLLGHLMSIPQFHEDRTYSTNLSTLLEMPFNPFLKLITLKHNKFSENVSNIADEILKLMKQPEGLKGQHLKECSEATTVLTSLINNWSKIRYNSKQHLNHDYINPKSTKLCNIIASMKTSLENNNETAFSHWKGELNKALS